jgi:hypothetical protein
MMLAYDVTSGRWSNEIPLDAAGPHGGFPGGTETDPYGNGRVSC